MIQGITKIKNFGIFTDFSPSGTSLFAERNIIYGWNYSGKTTLSRVFQCLENKSLHTDYSSASFTLVSETHGNITESLLGSYPGIVRVFNCDFVVRNLSWDGTTFNPILLLGKESIDLEKTIQKLNNYLQVWREGFSNKRAALKKIESDLADKKKKAASNIKTSLAIIETFNALHLDKLLTEVRKDGAKKFLLSAEKIPVLLKLALSSDKDKLPVVSKLKFVPRLSELVTECDEHLQAVPAFSNTIEYFKDHPNVARWVEQGLTLHEKSGVCEFCGNELEVQRVNELKSHFSKDLIEFRQRLSSLQVKVAEARILIEDVTSGMFYPEFRKDVDKIAESIKEAKVLYENGIDKLSAALQKKMDAPFNPLLPPNVNLDAASNLSGAIEELNQLIDKSNAITSNFESEKLTAITLLKKHYAAEFFVQEKVDENENLHNLYERHLNTYQKAAESLKNTKAALEAQINQAQHGREYLNELISNLLGTGALQIQVVMDGANERFQLVRGSNVAKNLSEGEKTAISFAFFISKLQEEKNLKEVIVYIDDPISSLDSNHIFQINALIREKFLYKDIADDDKWKITCKQLFISTHNFEFLSLLKDLPGAKKHRQNFYQLRRNSDTTTSLMNMPEAMLRFHSEYHYLYSLICDFHNHPNEASIEALLTIPNVVRRFVELYTMARLPINQEVDYRTEMLFGAQKAKRILKVLHYFSHSNNIERLTKSTDLICDIENAVTDLLGLIKADDPRHLAALDEAIA